MSDVPPWTWRQLDANAALDTWKELSAFVDWLVDRYELGGLVPACWWNHGAITEELTALWVSWIAAYLDGDAEPDAPLVWHERFAQWRTRVSEWDQMGCAQRGHRPGALVSWQLDRDAFALFVADDCTNRPGPHRLVTVEDSEGELPPC